MIEKLVKENIDIINSSLLDKETVINELQTNPYGKYLVYIENSEIIAYIYYSDIYERTEINQIEVREDKRNKKIGSSLLEEYLKITNKESSLEVRVDNKNAIKLYKKYGYTIITKRLSYYNGIDAYLMIRNV